MQSLWVLVDIRLHFSCAFWYHFHVLGRWASPFSHPFGVIASLHGVLLIRKKHCAVTKGTPVSASNCTRDMYPFVNG